jgi:hypothetical protein
VFERPPMRFIAMASVSCASLLMDPNDIAPVAKRLTISLAGSTSSIGTGLRRFELHQDRAACTAAVLLVDQIAVYSSKVAKLFCARRAAAC